MAPLLACINSASQPPSQVDSAAIEKPLSYWVLTLLRFGKNQTYHVGFHIRINLVPEHG